MFVLCELLPGLGQNNGSMFALDVIPSHFRQKYPHIHDQINNNVNMMSFKNIHIQCNNPCQSNKIVFMKVCSWLRESIRWTELLSWLKCCLHILGVHDKNVLVCSIRPNYTVMFCRIFYVYHPPCPTGQFWYLLHKLDKILISNMRININFLWLKSVFCVLKLYLDYSQLLITEYLSPTMLLNVCFEMKSCYFDLISDGVWEMAY